MKPAISWAFAVIGIAYVQNGHAVQEPRFSQLSAIDVSRMEQQRSVVAAAAKRMGAGPLTKTKADLPILQKLIDDQVFKKSQTYELQCLGVALGDVMTSELPLHWAMVTDEYGTDPTLRFKETAIRINALTMISKRIERDAPVDVSRLLRTTRKQLIVAQQKRR